MSTNYYLKRIPTEDEIAQCHKLLDERKIECCDICDEEYGTPYLQDVLGKMTEQIFIGKFSDGWRFLFRSHTDLYAKNIQSCLEYLQRQLDTGRNSNHEFRIHHFFAEDMCQIVQVFLIVCPIMTNSDIFGVILQGTLIYINKAITIFPEIPCMNHLFEAIVCDLLHFMQNVYSNIDIINLF